MIKSADFMNVIKGKSCTEFLEPFVNDECRIFKSAITFLLKKKTKNQPK